ncbi:serine/threonine-protein kinase [Fodinicola acaciae]|uniref:serine/threonine-protein kinase n=1 Tax=Fodinicola acaciae TaxID=2681555 RepID=UPI0013D4F482|nr:serine/threonine-protein kinase [Fodinicola acaciae]
MRGLEPADPRQVGGYRLLARIGSGGMGTVYFGRSAGGRPVAVKVLHPSFVADPAFRSRFRREVTAARTVGGGFSAPLLDADPDADVPWLVTEFLPAVSLRDAGVLPVEAVWPLAAGIAEALVSVHRAGIAHLDLKPANVLLTADGPRVIDFGIARAMDASTVTHAGVFAGSPGFMSPEQVAGRDAGPASDIFSLGSTLVYAVTGAEPYGDGTPYAKMYRIQHHPPLLEGVTDERLRVLIANLMVPDPAARPTAAQLTGYLASLQANPSSAWLPAPLLAEIQRRAIEAENPPAEIAATAPKNVSRRALLYGGIGAVAAAGVAAIPVVLGLRSALAPKPSPSKKPLTQPYVTRTPSTPATTDLEFTFTGKVTLTSITITINGRATTEKNRKLPWRKVIQVPQGKHGTYAVHYSYTAGELAYRVLIGGIQIATGSAGSTNGDTLDFQGDFDG